MLLYHFLFKFFRKSCFSGKPSWWCISKFTPPLQSLNFRYWFPPTKLFIWSHLKLSNFTPVCIPDEHIVASFIIIIFFSVGNVLQREPTSMWTWYNCTPVFQQFWLFFSILKISLILNKRFPVKEGDCIAISGLDSVYHRIFEVFL